MADVGKDVGAQGAPVDELLEAWQADARCFQCGGRVLSAAQAALLVGPNRVVHRDRCFVPALLRANPTLRLLAARERGREVSITERVTPPDPQADRSPDERPRAAGGGRG